MKLGMYISKILIWKTNISNYMHHYVDKKVEPPKADLYLDGFGLTLTRANWRQKYSFPTITVLTGGKKQPSDYNFFNWRQKKSLQTRTILTVPSFQNLKLENTKTRVELFSITGSQRLKRNWYFLQLSK